MPTSHNPSDPKNAEELGRPIFCFTNLEIIRIGFMIHVSCKASFCNHLFCLFTTRSESWHKLHTLYCSLTIFQCSTSLIRCKRTRFSRTCKRWSASRREVLVFFWHRNCILPWPVGRGNGVYYRRGSNRFNAIILLKNKITSVAVPRNFLFGIDFRCSTDDSRLLNWDVSQDFINWLCARWRHPSHGIEIPNMRGNITPGNYILILMQIGIYSMCI